ncbi:hypothetical protein OsI_08311 [Oryza sativa Indica Group]|uniref:Uncharacterized protein n=2 Tax=Oryza TaxID=4527 RepID=A0A0E0GAJ2_ORYNI|nr:hypothetical protein OsI_08311 [Oryza sativa Indica Group]
MASQALSNAPPPRGRAAAGGELGALTGDGCIFERCRCHRHGAWSSSTMITPPPRGAAVSKLGILSDNGAFCSAPTHLSSQSHRCCQRRVRVPARSRLSSAMAYSSGPEDLARFVSLLGERERGNDEEKKTGKRAYDTSKAFSQEWRIDKFDRDSDSFDDSSDLKT